MLAVTVTVTATACGDGNEPVGEWERSWGDIVATVAGATDGDLTPEQCQDLLGYLRVQRTVVTPVPLEDLETPVDTWFNEAESIFFDCDFDSDRSRETLLTLEAVEGEVDIVLEVEQ
ncbi:MAG TPA: hypothetical protein VFS66_03680 [Acidimicrobiia bacterium]|nr:hypothetical protein [Acidimicrobiia bacterium]